MGQCCPAEDANKVFDYRVDTMNSFKKKTTERKFVRH